MATTISTFSKAYNFAKLDTYNYTINTTAVHRVKVSLTDVTSVAGITVLIKQNSTTLATATGITGNPNGCELDIQALCNFTATDTMSVVITSTTASDAAPNQIKGFITLNISA